MFVAGAVEVTELRAMPQIRSTQTVGEPFWVVGSLVFVAQGILSQSVLQFEPTIVPWMVAVLPVMLKAMFELVVIVPERIIFLTNPSKTHSFMLIKSVTNADVFFLESVNYAQSSNFPNDEITWTGHGWF